MKVTSFKGRKHYIHLYHPLAHMVIDLILGVLTEAFRQASKANTVNEITKKNPSQFTHKYIDANTMPEDQSSITVS